MTTTPPPIDFTYDPSKETAAQYTARTQSAIAANNPNDPNSARLTQNTTQTPPTTTNLAQDQAKASNQGKPGYDVLGNPINPPQQTQQPTQNTQQGNQTNQNTPTQTSANDTLSATKATQDQLTQEQNNYQTQASSVSNQITNIQNGTTPLTAAEQAQVSGLQQRFQVFIDQQVLQNTGASGVANVRGYQTGAAEYDPNFQVKTIGAIVAAGQNKVADLQTKEAAAVASLTQSFKDNDIKAVQNAWAIYQDASKARQEALQKTIDTTSAAIKDARDQIQKQQELHYTQVEKPITDIATSAAENGAPSDVLTAIRNSTDPGAAIIASSSYLTKPLTGDIGEYQAYAGMAKKAGQQPLGYFEYLKAKTSATTIPKAVSSRGSSSGGSSSDTALIAQGIMDGNQPPTLTGLYGKSAAVRATLEKSGYNLTKASQDWTATTKLLSTMNGAQQVRLRQAVNQVDESLDLTKQLADEWSGGGFPLLNKASLIAAKNGALGAKAQSLATRLDAQISDITAELGTVYKGGNSSTDESLKLAAQNLQSNWSKQTFDDAVALAKKNVQIRKNSLNLTTAGIADSNYNPMNHSLIQDEAANEAAVIDYGKSHPDVRSIVTAMVKDKKPYSVIKEALNIK